MNILLFPNDILLKKCSPVESFDSNLEHIVSKMIETMRANNGIGLAANQVGLDMNMFVMEGPSGKFLTIINPTVLRKSIVKADFKEGCLSMPGEYVTIKERAEWIQISYKDISGQSLIGTFKGIYSVCIQHEMEHLEGKVFIENKSISKQKRLELAKKWNIQK